MIHSRYRGVLAGALPVIAIAIGLSSYIRASDSPFQIRARDDCDPRTFNLAVGPGTCVGNGGTTFTRFLQEFMEDGSVGAWRFTPDSAGLDKGQATLLVSRGGEFHTFTKVEKFGGGIVDILNTPGQKVAPECSALLLNGGPDKPLAGKSIPLFPGAAPYGPVAGTEALPVGKTRFQCCIHPWMQTTLEVKKR